MLLKCQIMDMQLILNLYIRLGSIEDTEDHEYYFSYHHSAGDSMTIMDADLLDGNVAGLACMFFILADL